jgi:ubiquinone/menaquinone biosynthesis C-methylase UbiE
LTLPAVHERNADQAAYWNGSGGRRWIDRQAMQDALLAPVSARLIAAARVKAGERVIDIGCGCGGTTLEIAAITGNTGRALGLDLSEPMIVRARERAEEQKSPAEFLVADATVHDFSGVGADLMTSRFGTMFFADPALSFANMRRGLKAGGRLVFVCWREARLNPWMTLPLRAVTRRAPRLPELGPEDPGPFSFADEARVRRILSSAGFADIALAPDDLELDIAVGRGLEDAVASALEIGPASRALQGQPEAVRKAAIVEMRAALEPLRRGDSVPLGAAIWIVSASAGV